MSVHILSNDNRFLDTLIQFEDFKYPHAYNLLTKCKCYKQQQTNYYLITYFYYEIDQNRITCFNDDIQSTSSITLAGILASLKCRGLKQEDLANEVIVCVGSGTGVGVCEGIVDCMVSQGRVKSREEAYSKIYMLDQYGLLGNPTTIDDEDAADIQGYQPRPTTFDERQQCYVKHNLRDQMSLEQVIKKVKPTVLLGLTGIGGVFSEESIREMAKHTSKPVVFPLSNPDTHAECTAEEAFKWTDGRAIFASGSPFKDVQLPNGKICKTNQCNNSYSFPGLGLGITVSRASRVTPSMFLEAARTIADMATPEQLKEGVLFPGVSQLREVALNVGTRVCEVAFEEGVATATLEEGEILSEVVRSCAYQPEYVPLVYHP